jgi:hypothetical protein
LSAILQVLTRYSANDPQFPVNDRPLFTGKSHAIGGRSAGKRNPADSADPKFKEGRQEVMWSAKRDSSTIATWMEQGVEERCDRDPEG